MRFLATLYAIIVSLCCFAQPSGFDTKFCEISGTILDIHDQPVIFVKIFVLKDSTVLSSAASDVNGYYSVQIAPGLYSLRVESIGYSSTTITGIFLNSNQKIKIDIPLFHHSYGPKIFSYREASNSTSLRTKNLDHVSDISSDRGLKTSLTPAATNSHIDIKNIALIIGTDNYTNWTHLSNPVFDAQTIAAMLQNDYGYEVTLLKNPTKTDVKRSLRDLFNRFKSGVYGSNGNLLIFIAGHGGYDDFTNGYIVTSDSKKASDDNFDETCLKHDELRGMIDNIPSQHTLVLLDVCYGGTFDQAISSNRHRGEYDEYAINYNELIERTMPRKSRKYITSGGKEYVPDGRPGHHSPFAYNLIAELTRCYETKHLVTFHSLCAALELIKPEPRAGEFGVNNDPGSDFILVPAPLLK